MKVVFVSNFFNHHQKPFCEEMYKRLGVGFVFIATSPMEEERIKLGYSQDDIPSYVLLAHAGEQQRKEALAHIDNADVVIAGSAPNHLLYSRIRKGKLLFRYGERPFKKKRSVARKIYHFLKLRQNNLWKKNIYMLCASAYAAKDYASIGMYKDRMFKWGYFPATKTYDIDDLLSRKKKNTLLWCGRFIDWKHPDHAVEVAWKLKEQGYDFHLNMIGTGAMEEELKQLVKTYGLEDCVHFLGSMPPERVRTHMEEAGIYLFTSDRQEGWGAVLNESMNSGCAVVASHAIGATPYLLRNGENGLIYPSDNVEMLLDKVTYLLEQPDAQYSMGVKAYQTVKEVWNAEAAVQRFMRLIEEIMADEASPERFTDGPCSIAQTKIDTAF